MTSGLRSFGIALVWLAFASILPAPVGARSTTDDDSCSDGARLHLVVGVA